MPIVQIQQITISKRWRASNAKHEKCQSTRAVPIKREKRKQRGLDPGGISRAHQSEQQQQKASNKAKAEVVHDISHRKV